MIGETILVMDAGQDVEQRMVTALEAENCLVYPVSSQDMNAEMAELLRPSLIYIKPLELSPKGLNPCKAIHAIPLLKKTPIIILASLEEELAPGYFMDYGVVDFLEPTFGPEELIEKTRTILGIGLPTRSSKEDEPAASPQPPGEKEKKHSTLLLPAIGIIILLMIAGVVFLAYQQFTPTRKPSTSPPVTSHLQVPHTVPKVSSKSQLPPERKVAEIPAPESPVPSTPPKPTSSFSSESSSQPPLKSFHSVQLGAFKNEDTAQALTKRFREKGYDAFTLLGVTKDGSSIYRVLVNKFEERKAAQKLAQEIQSNEEIKTTLYSE
jgi:cell division septation protein DedD